MADTRARKWMTDRGGENPCLTISRQKRGSDEIFSDSIVVCFYGRHPAGMLGTHPVRGTVLTLAQPQTLLREAGPKPGLPPWPRTATRWIQNPQAPRPARTTRAVATGILPVPLTQTPALMIRMAPIRTRRPAGGEPIRIPVVRRPEGWAPTRIHRPNQTQKTPIR